MSNSKPITFWALLVAAAAFLLTATTQPLWGMRMEAPQYREEEALNVIVYPNTMRGDLTELKTLNQYIGVDVPEVLPQFSWLPTALALGAILPLAGALTGRSVRTAILALCPLVLSIALGLAAIQARHQMHEIGHNRDAKTIMMGVKDFTPPFLGSAKIAQFQITSRFGVGTGLIGSAVALQLFAAFHCRRYQKSTVAPGQDLVIKSQSKEALA